MTKTITRQQRRYQERQTTKKRARDPIKLCNAAEEKDLIVTAYKIAAAKYGLEYLTADHAEALMYIAGRFTHLATGWAHERFGKDTVRLAYGLQCGGGKTLSAKAWIAAVHRLGKPYSVAVAANEVEALCQFKRELVEDFGVDPATIGLIHTIGNKASESATPFEELQDKQFVLVSHNMVRTGKRNLDLYNVYKGKPRDLVIYDESLLVSDVWSIKNKAIQAGLDFLNREIEFSGREDLNTVQNFVGDTLSLFLAEADAQADEGKVPQPVAIPDLSNYAADLYPDAAKLILPKDCPGSVRTLLDASGREVRVVTEAQRGVAWFKLKVPSELRSVFVLDASHLIRELPKLDSNIIEDPLAHDTGVSYEDLTIEYFQTPAGYGSIKEECNKPWRERKLAAKIAKWINSRPADERVNVWTFKRRAAKDPDIPSMLEATLARYKVDLDRVTILTHGSARGSNEFADAPHTAFYGVFEQDKTRFAGEIVGQSQDLRTSLERLEEVHKSEILHDAFQEIARSGVRKIVQGRAGRGSVLFPCWHVDVARRLNSDVVFKKATLSHREDLEDKEKVAREPHYIIVARSIVSTLSELTDDLFTVSSRKLKPLVQERVGFDVSRKMWDDAMSAFRPQVSAPTPYKREAPPTPRCTNDALADAGWKRSGRGFERLSAGDYGLAAE